jgi:hypothetical protein
MHDLKLERFTYWSRAVDKPQAIEWMARMAIGEGRLSLGNILSCFPYGAAAVGMHSCIASLI